MAANVQPGIHWRIGESRTKTWLLAITPLVLQVLSVVLLTIVIRFIDGRDFNLFMRRQFVTQPDGSIIESVSRLSPLQSDITTAVSSGVAILRIFTTIWSGATAWRCIFILMEKGGISLEQIDRILTWKIYFYDRQKSSRRNVVSFLVTIVLFAALPSQLSGPIITGSITWSPSQSLIKGQKPLTGLARSGLGDKWDWFKYWSTLGLTWQVPMAAGFADIGWQESRNDKFNLKRVIRGAEHLAINSTLNNITLPYFAVAGIAWITDPMKELPLHRIQSVSNRSISNPFSGQLPTTFTLIPDVWQDPYDGSFPSPSTVSETRLLAGVTGRGDMRSATFLPCGAQGPFGKIPGNVGFYEKPSESTTGLVDCYIFARVTYVAGAAECRKHCRLSSVLTVQNETALDVVPDPMTRYALNTMPLVARQMVYMNVSVPGSFNNLNEFVTQLLVRSYSAAWTALTDDTSDELENPTDVEIATPTSRANVLWWRVFLWLCLNLMFTFSGFLFVVVQSLCDQPLLGDPSLAAFLLDTTEIIHRRNRAFCNFSTLVGDDKGIGYLRFLRKPNDVAHKRVEVVDSESEGSTVSFSKTS